MTVGIRLYEEKFYFPGETIKGCVTVHPKTPTRTSQITLRFSGQAMLAIRERETISMFHLTKNIPVTAGILAAKAYSFPFEFGVPEDLNLPSAMEIDKKARVRYTLTAIQDRPMMPESLCPKTEYAVPILERIDTDSPRFARPLRHCIDIAPPHACDNLPCNVSLTVPRTAFTRGDIVPLDIVVIHRQASTLAHVAHVDLVRTVDVKTHRHAMTKEHTLRSTRLSLGIAGSDSLVSSHSLQCQLLIPTSTPPTVCYMSNLLRVHYKARVRICLADAKMDRDMCTLEIPFTVGTWPRAAVPIDDEEPPRSGSTMLSEDTYTSTLDTRDSTLLSPSMVKHSDHDGVGRSDSNASRSSSKSFASMSSCKSGQSWENASAWSDPPPPSSSSLLLNGPSRHSSGFIPVKMNPHSVLDPSLMARTDPPVIPHRYSFYDMSGHPALGRSGSPFAPGHTLPNYRHAFQPSDDIRSHRFSSARLADVPTHILLPTSSSLPSPPSPISPSPRRPHVELVSLSTSESQGSDSSDEGDGSDLLTMLNKKRRQAHRAKQEQEIGSSTNKQSPQTNTQP